MRRASHRIGFTIVELLVVITIMVILLALLAPALDQAIYQAELAVCGARLDATASGAITYAFDHKRFLPVRNFGMTNRDAKHLAGIDFWGGNGIPGAYSDERPVLRGYIAVNKMLIDPLTRAIELEDTAPGSDVFQAYMTWYGWRYLDPDNYPQPLGGMHKLGQQFEWNGRRFSVLAGDYDEYQLAFGRVYSSHPDREGTMSPQVLENEGGLADVASNLYLTRWKNDSVQRSPLDLNYAYTDGSVRRLNNVKMNRDPASTERTIAVATYADGSRNLAATDFHRLPAD